MIILVQWIVNKLSMGFANPYIVCVCASGGGKSSSSKGFTVCAVLCYSEALAEESQDYAGSGSIQNIYPYPGGAAG